MILLDKIVNSFFARRKYTYKEDTVLLQERFEPAGWCRPINEQINVLKKYLPAININSDYVKASLKKYPKYNQIVIPKIDYLSRLTALKDPYFNIGVLIEHVCEIIGLARAGNFTHYRQGQLGSDRIRPIEEIVYKRNLLEESVPGDILILNVDLGNKYAGWTPRRARVNIINNRRQLALFAVDIAWILLINPNRLERNIDLSIDSVGEEYFSLDRGWVTNLFFYYRGGKLEFGYRWNRRAYFDCGAGLAKI